MKLLKIKHIIPLSAAAITFVCSQSTAEASTIHTVQKNDTLWGISKQYGVSIQSIKQANHKGNDQTFIGEQLHIPVPRTQIKLPFVKTSNLQTLVTKLYIKFNRETH